VFLWNAIAPTKNQLNGATDTLSGTTTAGGADGQYHNFTPAGEMEWAITKPASAYTLVWSIVMPSSLGTFVAAVMIPNGNFRVEVQRTGGGVYVSHTHTLSAAPGTQYVEGTGSPDSEMITYVAAYDGTTLRRYLKLGDGTNASNLSEALAYNNGGDSVMRLGNADGSATYGGYMLGLLNNDVGNTECLALRDNAWRLFAPEVVVDSRGTVENRNKKIRRPGRGPYSKGAFRRPSIDVLPQTYWTVDSDAASATDTSDATAAFNVSAADTASAADSADSASAGNNSVGVDAVSGADSTSATGVFTVDAADSFAINDAAVSTQGSPIVSDRTATNKPRPGRTPYSLGRYFRPRIDVFTNTFNVTAAESVAAVDAASTTIVGVASAADSVSITDSASTQITVALAASDSISINDGAASTAAGDRDAADAVNPGESAEAIIVGSAFAAEVGLALGDSADTSLFSGNNLFATEVFNPIDAANTAGSVYVGEAADAQALTDLASAVKIGVFDPSADSRCRVDTRDRARATKGRVGGRRI
jgi:hypothetical protein